MCCVTNMNGVYRFAKQLDGQTLGNEAENKKKKA